MNPRYQLFQVKPALPARLVKLMDLAYNLRWAWHPESAELFFRLDPELWEKTAHNPVRMLGTISQERLEWASTDPVFLSHMDRVHQLLQELLQGPAWFQHFHGDAGDLTVAYFSAEFGLAECLPIYSGGLGILAGDHLKSAHELGVPLVGVGLAYKTGYLSQYLNPAGWQQETYIENDFYNMPLQLEQNAEGGTLLVGIPFPGREVKLRIWRAEVGRVSLYLLDANVPENTPEDQRITEQLYGGDKETRLQHEIVLGIGGMRALAELGIRPQVSHINEGHAAFLILERIRMAMRENNLSLDEARQLVSASSIFTTHTPVPAGFDLFSTDLMRPYFEDFAGEIDLSFEAFMAMGSKDSQHPKSFNMALFAMRNSTYRNGVSRLHGEVSRKMWEEEWPGYPEQEIPVDSITNGIHTRSWISGEMTDLLNRYLGPGWSENPADTAEWERVDQIPDQELWQTHMASKQRLVSFAREKLQNQVRSQGGSSVEVAEARRVLDPNRLTLGFARRFATYKRATLILQNPERLKRILTDAKRPVQFVFAGKAHPADTKGKELIQGLYQFARDHEVRDSVVYIEDYDMHVGRLMTQGVDVWLNTPRRPFEASGTSGMKAAANGVLNMSVLDGWWDEGFHNDVGWAIGKGEIYEDSAVQDEVEANAFYDLLEQEIIPTYYTHDGEKFSLAWTRMMKASIERLAPVFNSNRMVGEYTDRFYIPAARRTAELLRDDHQGVRDLVGWRRDIDRHWSGVVVEKVNGASSNHLEVGVKVPVEVFVRLGELAPENVSVELYHGRTNAKREVERGSVTRLEFSRRDHELAVFSGTLVCGESGLYGYAVRVRPAHPLAVIPHEDPRIAWF